MLIGARRRQHCGEQQGPVEVDGNIATITTAGDQGARIPAPREATPSIPQPSGRRVNRPTEGRHRCVHAAYGWARRARKTPIPAVGSHTTLCRPRSPHDGAGVADPQTTLSSSLAPTVHGPALARRRRCPTRRPDALEVDSAPLPCDAGRPRSRVARSHCRDIQPLPQISAGSSLTRMDRW